jgi:YD repeat-containing protein
VKITYDPEVDALSMIFRETTVTTKHLAEGIAADYDAHGRLAGIEILDALKRFGDAETLRHVVLEGVGPAASGQ